MLELKEVSKFYSSNGITNIGLHNVNLKLSRNEIIAITGESGSGKSTLLNVISKIDTFDEGEIYYYGNETSYFSISDMDDFRKNKVGFIFQNYNILDSYTVLDNVMIPLLLRGFSKEDARVEAMLLIKKVGLDGREKHRGTKLSGGEKQRCVIARALAGDCDILACDEPTGNLDSETALEIIKLIKEVAKDKLVLIVTHNYPEVEGIATRLLKMSDGKIVEDIVFQEALIEEPKQLDLDYKPMDKKVIWTLGLNNIIRTPKKTVVAAIMYFIISFCFLFVAQAIGSLTTLDMTSSEFVNSFDNRVFVYNAGGKSFDESLLKDYNYEINDFSSECSYFFDGLNYSSSIYYASNQEYEILSGRKPEDEYEFVLIYNNPTNNEVRRYASDIGSYLEIKLNNGTGSEKFKLVGIGEYNSKLSNQTFATDCERLQQLLNKVCPKYYISLDGGYHEFINYNLIPGYSSPKLYVPTSLHESSNSIEVFAEMYKLSDIEIVSYGGQEIYLEISTDGPTNLEPYFASVYTKPNKAKSVIKDIKALGLKAVYPVEYTNENLLTKILINFLAIIFISEVSVYLIGIFFIVYVILGRVYRSRVKDYSILRTLGITKKDMAKVVNVEMLLIGYGITIFTYLFFNGLVYAVDALTFLRSMGISAFIMYFLVMFIFVSAMSKRFNKRIFRFTVRESVRGDDDND